ncbi:SWIM zinc finger domain-containing protein [Paractinoplanes rhizophilus]|uniref:SWIM zinc finger domain-containing protein n=1 Tax=Paractinoplanes rhizophilus TaxID=1416877 RepID=A0ABW2HNK7_9ACTN
MAWFTEVDLEELAGSRSFSRGLGYVEAVVNVRDLPNGVVATVHGSDAYQVRLYDTDGEFDGECDCPYGEEGNFCKHCVAVGLRLLRRSSVTGAAVTGGTSSDAGAVDVRAFLGTLDHSELVELVWSQVSEDPALYQRMLLRAIAGAQTVDLPLLARQVENLAVDWLQYGEEEAYAAGADAVVAALAELLPEHAEQVRPLLQRTLELLGQAAGRSEDHCGAALASAAEAWDVFLAACDDAPPDPVELGSWFAQFRLTGVDILDMSITDVADLLGTDGLDAYWNALDTARDTDPSGWTVRSLREEMIRAAGDVDLLVACYAEDLSTPDRYVLIARLLRENERTAEAVGWLERGRAASGRSDHRIGRLVDLLIELYTEAGRTADVMDLHWERFHVEGTVGSYQRLREFVLATDPQRWPQRREEALGLLRTRATGGDAGNAWNAGEVYLRVLLSEDRDEAAWEMLGQVRCEESTRLAVAGRRAVTHPAEALKIYLPAVETAVARANTADYEQAADLLVTLRDICQRAGTDHAAEVTRLKAAHSRKRNFMAALRQRGL